MKPPPLLMLCLCLLLFGCPPIDRVDTRDHAIDTYYPKPNEIQLAQNRVSTYWRENSQRLPPTTYLAVSVTSGP